MNAGDIDARIANEGRVPLVPLVHVDELQAGGLVMRDENVKVTANARQSPARRPFVRLSFRYRRSFDRHFRRHYGVREHRRMRISLF
jgi:hypothetical protein